MVANHIIEDYFKWPRPRNAHHALDQHGAQYYQQNSPIRSHQITDKVNHTRLTLNLRVTRLRLLKVPAELTKNHIHIRDATVKTRDVAQTSRVEVEELFNSFVSKLYVVSPQKLTLSAANTDS
jgi:hypothetical protein